MSTSYSNYRSYNEQLNDDAQAVVSVLKMVGQFLAIFIAPIACAIAVAQFQGPIDEHAKFAWWIALAAIAGKVLLDVCFLYSLRLYNREFTVNRELNHSSVKAWFKWTGFATAVAITATVAVAFSDTTLLMAVEKCISFLS